MNTPVERQAPKVTVIPAIPKSQNQRGHAGEKLRVAAYCRVSSDSEEQLTSYENQLSYFSEYIRSKPEWKLVRVFADEGVTGTSVRKRKDFQRMLRACREGRIDLILVKSVSRFGRNVKDTIEITRKLSEMGVGVIFEKENLDTRKGTSEFLLGLHGLFSQSESESIRENVLWGQQKTAEKGLPKSKGFGYGFTEDEHGTVCINEEEADVIRKIAKWFLDGMSFRDICTELEDRGIKSPKGNPRWNKETVKSLLSNDKYKGDFVWGKTFKPDLFSGKIAKNNGERNRYIYDNVLPPIFDRDYHKKIELELARRQAKRSVSSKAKTPFGKHSKYALSSLLVCDKCGAYYRRVTLKPRNKTTIVWKCGTHQEKAADCPHSPRLLESKLHAAIMTGICREYFDAIHDMETTLDVIRQVISSEPGGDEYAIRSRITELKEEKQQIITLCLEENDDEKYEFQLRRITNELNSLKEQLGEMESRQKEAKLSEDRLHEIEEIMSQYDNRELAYDDVLVRKTIEVIRVLSADRLEITFRDGRTAEVHI